MSLAAPLGGVITNGNGSITQNGTTTTIHQTSHNLGIDWQNFNIAPQETVTFIQPSTSSLAINRILDVNGTQILGRLNANGQVYLINPNGVLFGSSAQVNVGGLVASTLPLDHGPINWYIKAKNGGYAALLSKYVSNQDNIIAGARDSVLASVVNNTA